MKAVFLAVILVVLGAQHGESVGGLLGGGGLVDGLLDLNSLACTAGTLVKDLLIEVIDTIISPGLGEIIKTKGCTLITLNNTRVSILSNTTIVEALANVKVDCLVDPKIDCDLFAGIGICKKAIVTAVLACKNYPALNLHIP